MLILNPSDGRILDANDAAVKFHGYPYEVLTQMYTNQLIVALSEKELAKIRHEAYRKTKLFYRTTPAGK